MNNKNQSRRKFLYDLGLAGLSIPLISGTMCNDERKSNPLDMIKNNKAAGKLGIALVGLGNYATNLLATALQETEHCYVAGIVTGTPSKIPGWKSKYNI